MPFPAAVKVGPGMVAVLFAVAALGCDDDGTPSAPQLATRLAFTMQPSSAGLNAPLTPTVEVAVQDASGNTVASATNLVTLTVGSNPSGGTLSGTTSTNAAAGVASFPDIAIDRLGTGYMLVAQSDNLTSATSGAFDIIFAFQSLTAGSEFTCGLTTAGEAYCWGLGTNGQLGDGASNTSNIPVAVAGDHEFQSISAGFDHTCGVTTGGAVYCWGGQVSSAVPVPLSGGPSFESVGTGVFHSCGLTPTGQAYCWGDNSFGQLGDGTMTASATPVPVAGGLTFQALDVHGRYACGLAPGGEAYCWGDNSFGQLGDGTTTDRSAPVQVAGGLAFQSLTTGSFTTCALTGSGDAYCWGENNSGQLGDGTTNDSPTPVAVTGGHSFASLSSGSKHSCGVSTGGAAYCWGINAFGELGNGSTSSFESTPVAVGGGVAFASVAARGPDHTCGIATSGVVYCWGNGFLGRLGNGATDNQTMPVRIADPDQARSR